jgi:transcriptional regulator with XRE-family HTH domain
MPPAPIVDCAALREARRRAGLTQHELARLAGVAGGERVSRWELGTAEPRPAVVVKVAEVLGVQVDELLLPADGPASLRRLRFRAGMSMRELAEHAQVSLATMKRWEAGDVERPPNAASLRAVADALCVPVEDVGRVLRRTSPAPPPTER